MSYVLGSTWVLPARPRPSRGRARTTSSRSTSATAGAVSHRCCTSAPTAAWTSAGRPSGGRRRARAGGPRVPGPDRRRGGDAVAGEPVGAGGADGWLVRWVVDRSRNTRTGQQPGSRSRAPPRGTTTASNCWRPLAEQDLDVTTFLADDTRAEWHSPTPDDAAPVASAAAGGAALALLAGDVEAERTDDVAARMAALARFPGIPEARTGSDPDNGPSADVPAPRTHHSGSWSTEGSSGPGEGADVEPEERQATGAGRHPGLAGRGVGRSARRCTGGVFRCRGGFGCPRRNRVVDLHS